MDSNTLRNSQRSRFLKLSLKKNKMKTDDNSNQNRSSDVIILDESFDKLMAESAVQKKIYSSPKIYSPIIINDSDEVSIEDLPMVTLREKEPSKAGNVSFNGSMENKALIDIIESRPSNGGWSPAQSIICATPRQHTVPSTPKDLANESMEQCSIKKIQNSQKKLLNDLYGESWKSIPKLFKPLTNKYDNFNGVSKKLQFNEDDESDKENIKYEFDAIKKLHLTASESKIKFQNELNNTEKKSKKKLYTEKVPSTPDLPRRKPVKITRNVSTTVKKKGMSVTELVEIMKTDGKSVATDQADKIDRNIRLVNTTVKKKKPESELVGTVKNDVDFLTRKVQNIAVATPVADEVKRLSFIGSLADNVPSWRCHVEALQYVDKYKTLREQLTHRLYVEFNRGVFGGALDADMPVLWDAKLRSTAGTTTNRTVKTSNGSRIRTSSIKLSTKVLDTPQRLRDTLIHELCHAATWLIDGELRAGHGPLWKKWAKRALRVYPELGEISRCHDLEIHFKYSYKCTKCGYSIQRHSKSIDVTKKCCGYCRGTFEVIVNKKNKDGVVISTPARKGGPNDFALYVKEHYATLKDGKRTHAQVMKVLGEQFSAKKNKQKVNLID